VGAEDDIARLRSELRITRALLEEIKGLTEQTIAPPFAEVVLQERRRAERYNHYFCLVTLSSPKVDAMEVVRRASQALRSSDTVGIVDAKGRYYALSWFRGASLPPVSVAEQPGKAVVGMILPETDRKGAESAVQRVSGNLTDAGQVKVRMAVYPEDSTNVEDLVAMAVA